MDRTLDKSERLGKSQELKRLFVAPNRLQGETVAIRYAFTDNRRVAFTTRGIKLSVERNWIKRQLKEIYRQNKDCFPKNYDYLFIARPKTVDQDFSALKTEVLGLARRLAHA